MDSTARGSIVSLHLKRKQAFRCCLCLQSAVIYRLTLSKQAIYGFEVFEGKKPVYHFSDILTRFCLTLRFLIHT